MKLREENVGFLIYYYFGGMAEDESFIFLASSSLTQAFWHKKNPKTVKGCEGLIVFKCPRQHQWQCLYACYKVAV